MATIYFLCGMPASGKTTFARKLALEKQAVRFTLDERMIAKYDYSIFDEEYGPLANAEKELIWVEAQDLLRQGQNVIIDWSLWSRAARSEWPQKALAAGYDYKLYYLDAPIELLRQRLAARNGVGPAGSHNIPLEELERFHTIFQPPSPDEELNLERIQVR